MTEKALKQQSATSGGFWRRWLGRDFGSALLLGGPAFLGITVFLIVPAILAFGYSFTNQRLLSPNPTEWVGLRNYQRALSVTLLTLDPVVDEETGEFVYDAEGNLEYPRSRSITRSDARYDGFSEWFTVDIGQQRHVILATDPEFLRSFINTFYFVVLVLPLQLGLALAMALLVNQKLPGVNIFRTIYFSPVVTSMVVVSLVWRNMYAAGDNGLINQMLANVSGGVLGPYDWLGDPGLAMPAVVLMSPWQGMGFQMIIFVAGLQGISGDLYEAAGIDGANILQKFRYVTLPGLRNTFVFIIIATTIAAFGLFTQINVMTQGGPADATTTVMYHIYRTGFREQNIAGGVTMSVIYFVIILFVALIQNRVLRDEVQNG